MKENTPDVATLPGEYTDEQGTVHILCACGHYVTGPKSGSKINLCPNCQIILRVDGRVTVERSDRLTDDMKQTVRIA